ncbi:MAG: hypothetical protein ACRDFS_04990 [Chloroflexota bacterium]
MDRSLTEEQEDQAAGGDIGIGDGDIAATNRPSRRNPADGTGTPEGTDTGETGVIRTSAAPGETGGYGSEATPGSLPKDQGGLSGGYGTGGVDPEEQAQEPE